MPTLDRRIVVRVAVDSVNDFGELVSTTVDHSVWAGVADLSAFDTEERGGTFTERLRKWTIRWRSDFAALGTEELTVIDGGQTYNVTNIVRQQDGAERRRFMLIEGVTIP